MHAIILTHTHANILTHTHAIMLTHTCNYTHSHARVCNSKLTTRDACKQAPFALNPRTSTLCAKVHTHTHRHTHTHTKTHTQRHTQTHTHTNTHTHRHTHTHTPLPPQVVASMDVLASARQAVDVWAPLAHHPALVGLRRSFVTSDYDPQTQPALCFAYDFHPGKIAVCV